MKDFAVTAARASSGGWVVTLLRNGVCVDIIRAKIRPRVVRVGVQRKAQRLQLLDLRLLAKPEDRAAIESERRAVDLMVETPRIYEYGSRPVVMTQVWNRTTRAVEMLGYVEVAG